MQGDQVSLNAQTGERPAASHGDVRLWLKLTGEFEARVDTGASILPTSKKARALLALVAAHMPQPIRREVAASLLWSGKPRDHAGNSLRQALRELQVILEQCGEPPVLLTGGGRLGLRNESVWVDIHDSAYMTARSFGKASLNTLQFCQNLRNLDPALDQHLDELWKKVLFQQAFVPQPDWGSMPSIQAAVGFAEDQADLPLIEPVLTPSDSVRQDQNVPRPRSYDESLHGRGWRIAVLPFRSLGTPLEGGLSLGLAEEISSALARYRMPRLVATGSFWDGHGPSADALSKCRAYNLDYAIIGTIQTSGHRIRVTVTLLDVSMEFEVIWASRFEGTTHDLFKLQDTIASQTVAQIDPELLQRHQFRGEAIQTPNAAAHQVVLTAIQGIYRPDKTRFLQARDLLVHASMLDREYAAAHAWLAYWYIVGVGQGWVEDPNEASVQAGQAAERAIMLDPLDARGVTIAGHVKAYLLHDLEAALSLHERAISLNPNLPIAWALSSWAHIYNGAHRTALDHALMAESLSPTDPHVFFAEHAAMTAHLFLRDLEQADVLAASVLERKPGHASALKVRLAILGHLGRLADAGLCINQLKALGLPVSVDQIIARPPLREKDREYYAEGLRRAGVAE